MNGYDNKISTGLDLDRQSLNHISYLPFNCPHSLFHKSIILNQCRHGTIHLNDKLLTIHIRFQRVGDDEVSAGLYDVAHQFGEQIISTVCRFDFDL